MSIEDNVLVTVKIGTLLCEKGKFQKGGFFIAPRSFAEKFDVTFVDVSELPKTPAVEPVVEVKPAVVVAPVPLEAKPVVKKAWSAAPKKPAATQTASLSSA